MDINKILESENCKYILHRHGRWKKGMYAKYLQENKKSELKPISKKEYDKLFNSGYIYTHIDLRFENKDKKKPLWDFAFFDSNKLDSHPFEINKDTKLNAIRYVPHDPETWLNRNKVVDVFFNDKSQQWEFIETIETGILKYNILPSMNYKGNWNYYFYLPSRKQFYYMYNIGNNAGRPYYKFGIWIPKEESKKSSIAIDILSNII